MTGRHIRLAAPQVSPPRKTTDWRSRAACAAGGVDPELFFPVGCGPKAQVKIREAKQVCARCPVQPECLRWALEMGQVSGVWGGLDERELIELAPSGSVSSMDWCRANRGLIEERRAQKVSWHALAAELGVRTGTVQQAAQEFEADRLQEIDALLTGQSEEVSA